MAYEIDVIGIPATESTEDADAIAVRWCEEPKGMYLNSYKVMVYDGGFQAHGKALVEHIKKFYFNGNTGVIDAVVVSHPDQDHASGVKEILNTFRVEKLYMNRPWLYVNELYSKVDDGRITPSSLEYRLREKYKYIAELEELANEKGIPIEEAFQGKTIAKKWIILSPTKEFYKQLIVESPKTPLQESRSDGFVSKVAMKMSNALESWGYETLRENVETTPDNEMSVVLHGFLDTEGVLLTGDAGIRALKVAMDYADKIKMTLKDNLGFIQIPHHGSRHNVSPSVLDRLIGPKVYEELYTGKLAFASVAANSDHPLKMVVNAFLRRGVKVVKTRGRTICHNKNIKVRYGWGPVPFEKFEPNVEEWDE